MQHADVLYILYFAVVGIFAQQQTPISDNVLLARLAFFFVASGLEEQPVWAV